MRSQDLYSVARVSNTPCPLLQAKPMKTIFRSFHWNGDLPRYVRVSHLHTQRVETYGVPRCRFKNDLESEYPFPRIAAMQGDGKTSYDVGKDGIPTQLGECAVRTDIFLEMSLRFLTNNTGRLPPGQGSDKTQSYLCQRHGIGRTSAHTFFWDPHIQYASR